MERQHSLLNPSSAEIWLNCTRAPRFAARFEKKKSDYADEGTLCHDIAADQLWFRTGKLLRKPYLVRLAKHRAHRLYQPEMDGYAESFVNYVLELFYSYRQKGWADIWIERRIDYDHVVPEGYGHLDVGILSPGVIDIIDLKYGKGIPVSAVANKQLGLYAIGVIEAAQFNDEFKNVNLHIFQPRLDNISTYTSTVDEYKIWAEVTVKPAAALAWEGRGKFVAGSHCRFCAALPKCQAATDRHMSLAKHDFAIPYEMSDDDIAEVLLAGENLLNWYTAVKEYASDAARKGKKFPGFKLVPGKSMRKYAEGKEQLIIKTMHRAGYKDWDFMKPMSLYGIGEMTKLLGEAKLYKLLGKYLIKPPGIPTLVPESDRRKSISGIEGAQNDFKHLNLKK